MKSSILKTSILFIFFYLTTIPFIYAHIDPHSKEFENLTQEETDDDNQAEKGFIGEIFLQPGFIFAKKNPFHFFHPLSICHLKKKVTLAIFFFLKTIPF